MMRRVITMWRRAPSGGRRGGCRDSGVRRGPRRVGRPAAARQRQRHGDRTDQRFITKRRKYTKHTKFCLYKTFFVIFVFLRIFVMSRHDVATVAGSESLRTQRIDRIEPGGPPRRVEAEEDAHRG